MLAGSLRDPAGSVDSDAVGRVWQAFGYSSGFVPLSFMGTVLVSSSGCRELVVDDAKAHPNFERQVDLVDVIEEKSYSADLTEVE